MTKGADDTSGDLARQMANRDLGFHRDDGVVGGDDEGHSSALRRDGEVRVNSVIPTQVGISSTS